MNLGEYPTFFESFYFVRQNNCQFGLDANIENIATYFNLFSVVKLILVKIWHNSCNEFMSWSQKFPDVSLPDVTWSVSLSRQCSTSVRCTEFSFVEIHAEKLSTKFAHFQPAWWMLVFILSVCLELCDVALQLSWSPTLYFRRGPPQGASALPPIPQ